MCDIDLSGSTPFSKGTYGEVYKIGNNAVKKEITNSVINGILLREVDLLKRFKSSSLLVSITDLCHKENYFLLVMPFYKMDLWNYSREYDNFTRSWNLETLVIQTCAALNVLKNFSLAHYDIKPSNILLDVDLETGQIFRVFVADYGLVENIIPGRLPPKKDTVYSRGFRAPEFSSNSNVVYNYTHNSGMKSDIWALGVVFCYYINGRVNIEDFNIISYQQTEWYEYRDILAWIKLMLNSNPDKRPSIETIVGYFSASDLVKQDTYRIKTSIEPFRKRPVKLNEDFMDDFIFVLGEVKDYTVILMALEMITRIADKVNKDPDSQQLIIFSCIHIANSYIKGTVFNGFEYQELFNKTMEALNYNFYERLLTNTFTELYINIPEIDAYILSLLRNRKSSEIFELPVKDWAKNIIQLKLTEDID